MRYLIEDSEIKQTLPIIDRKMPADKLVLDFDPHNDTIDKRILFELTGRKIEPQDYLDDSSASSNSAGEDTERLETKRVYDKR